MVNSQAPSKRKGLSLVLALLMFLSIFGIQLMQAEYSYAHVESYNGIYCTQMGSGKCTLASAVMMMRSKAKMEGNSSWESITQSRVLSTAWSGGLLHSFTYAGISVSYANFSSGDVKSQLIAILQKHPEGFEIYDRGTPHAVFLTRYDSYMDTFYCADPAYSAGEMPLASSWIGKQYSYSQSATVTALDAYWYVSAYNGVAAAAYDKEMLEMVKAAQAAGTLTGSNNSDQIIDDGNGTAPVFNFGTPSLTSSNVDGLVDDSTLRGDAIINSSDVDVVVSFDRSRSYKEGQFKDVKNSDWFSEYVKTAFEMSLMNGISADKFDTSGNITAAQSVTLAARIHSIYMAYNGSSADFSTVGNEAWYMPYADYAYAQGVISTDIYSAVLADPDKQVTRLEFANIVENALPSEALAEINNVPYGQIPDVDANTPAGKAVYAFYRSGVLIGSDGLFKSNNKITRAEVSAVISRIGDSSQRITL